MCVLGARFTCVESNLQIRASRIALAFSSFMYWFFHWPVLGLASKSKPPPSLNKMKHLDWLRTGRTTRWTVI